MTDSAATLARPETLPPGPSPVDPRRHDLDALRGIAMLLGIALHASLSFAPIPWPVQDSQQSVLFALFFAAIHGFRMPLFFLLSGFFTAMLWQRRGLQAVVGHRFRRVLLPCMVGLVTIVPLVSLTSIGAMLLSPVRAENESLADRLPEESPLRSSETQGTEPESPVLRALADQSRLTQAASGSSYFLVYFPVFHHLWFLWYLWWLVVGFAAVAWLLEYCWRGSASTTAAVGCGTWKNSHLRILVLSPVVYLWLIPLTMIPQSLMGRTLPIFGPDTSTGLIPAPQIFAYYAIFFGFGAVYYLSDDRRARLGRWWPLLLAAALLVVFPLGLDFTHGGFGFRDRLASASSIRLISVLLQTAYAWLMTFGSMGLFRVLLARESKSMRYLSDSSYWLYLAHLPLIFVAQAVVRSWPLPAALKFLLVCTVVTGILLISYQTMIRYTWLGTFLNGPRTRPGRKQEPIPDELLSE